MNNQRRVQRRCFVYRCAGTENNEGGTMVVAFDDQLAGGLGDSYVLQGASPLAAHLALAQHYWCPRPETAGL